MTTIQDDFTNQKLSRQRKYQLRMEQQGRCRICGKKSAKRLCGKHDKMSYLAQRKRRGSVRVYGRRNG